MKVSKSFQILTAAFILGIFSPVHAEDLVDVLGSKVMEDMTSEAKSRYMNQNSYRWLPEGRNFSKLFVEKRGPELLYSWNGIKDTSYRVIKQTSHQAPQYVAARVIYLSAHGNYIQLDTMVPHPRYRDWVEFTLLDDFAHLEPPKLDVEYSEDIQVNDVHASLYRHRRGGTCSILLRLTAGSRVNLTSQCIALDDMKELAKMLSVDKLQAKLQS